MICVIDFKSFSYNYFICNILRLFYFVFEDSSVKYY